MKKAHWLVLFLSLMLLVVALTQMALPIGAAGFTVDSTGDGGDSNTADGVCDDGTGKCTLRAAIEQANWTSGSDTISFDISGCTTVCPIVPTSQLPTLAGEITLDGTTQTDNQGDTNTDGPEIALVGASAGTGVRGLYIQGNLNEVRGLIISGFDDVGVYITQGMTNTVAGCYIGTDHTGTIAAPNAVGIYVVDDANWNTIGGATKADRNLISGNTGSGVVIEGVSRSKVWGNTIGADRTGTARLSNGVYGVHIWGAAEFNLVGGELPEHGNLISGNDSDGVRIEGEGTWGNRVGGNTIGLNAAQSASLHNGHHGVGLYDGTHYNDVGSGTLETNVIGGNGWSGVAIVNSDVTAVYGNYIGTNAAGAQGLGNAFHGVDIFQGQDNSVSSCTIAYNGLFQDGNGVRVREATAHYNIITQNSIHHNGGKGILLVNSAQDNILAPVITSASCFAVSGTACSNCTVEIFSDTEDEGQYPHTPYAYADGAGNWSWSGEIIGPNVTATALDGSDNTSEFSSPVEACYRVKLPLVLKNHHPAVGP